MPSDGHITLAWGRDYDDVGPSRGILIGGQRHWMDVSVDVVPIEPACLSNLQFTSRPDIPDPIWQNLEWEFYVAKGGRLQHFGAFISGIVIGFLGGLFGKGGSAIA